MTDREHDIDAATIESAAAAIVRYLAEHPGSADTLEGVCTWWLVRQRMRETPVVVAEALDLLEGAGTIRRRLSADGRAIYTLASCTDES